MSFFDVLEYTFENRCPPRRSRCRLVLAVEGRFEVVDVVNVVVAGFGENAHAVYEPFVIPPLVTKAKQRNRFSREIECLEVLEVRFPVALQFAMVVLPKPSVMEHPK